MRLRNWTVAASTALLVATSPLGALAQTSHDDHPAETAVPAPAPKKPATGMPGQADMKSGGKMESMPMKGNMMGMMKMMGGMEITDHIEGRIAFLRTEIKITNSQTRAWNDFADALRANAKKMGNMHMSMMEKMGDGQSHPPGLLQRLDFMEQGLTARLEGIRGFKTASTGLYRVLSDEQKKVADELLAPHMGMKPMGMMGMGQPSQSEEPAAPHKH